MKCDNCNKELEGVYRKKELRKMGIMKRTNYPHGRKSRGITTFTCICGGMFTESPGDVPKW